MINDGGNIDVHINLDTEGYEQGAERVMSCNEFIEYEAKKHKEEMEKLAYEEYAKKAGKNLDSVSESAQQAFGEAKSSAEEFGLAIESLGNSIKAIGFGALLTGATALTTSLVKLTKAGVAETRSLQDTQVQMIGLTHSVQAGQYAMAEATKYYKNNPFTRFEVTNATKSLLQFGAAVGDIPQLLKMLGEVSMSTGANIDTLAYYYQRAISSGRISTRDLETLQMQGVGIFDALAKQINVSRGAVRELAAQGKISAEDLLGAFQQLADSDAMAEFEKTLSRQMNRLEGRMSDMRAAIVGAFTDDNGYFHIAENSIYSSITKLVKKFSDLMTSSGDDKNPIGMQIIEGFKKISEALGKIVDKITKLVEPALNLLGKLLNFVGDNSAMLIPIIGGVLVMIGRLGQDLPFIGGILRSVNSHIGGLFHSLKEIVMLKPGLSALIALLAVGFVQAYKESEEFRTAIKDLLGAFGQLAQSLMTIVKTVLPAFIETIKAIASSDFVRGVLQGIAGALAGIAKAIASISPSTLAGFVSFFISLKLLNANPIMYAVYAISLLVMYIHELGKTGNVFEGIAKGFRQGAENIVNNFKGVLDWIKNLPQQMSASGHNMMVGLLNGLINGAKKVAEFVRNFAQGIVDTFKSILQIHSPSKAMYYIGQYITLGLAEGITDSKSAVQVALDRLATDILALSDKVIKNKVDFGILDIKQEYQEWKKVAKLFTEGSEQYNKAIEKMEDTRKAANLQILNLQQTYNKALDDTINKIGNMYGLFDDVKLAGGKNSQRILKDLDKQVASMQEWAEAQEMIRNLGLDEALVEELQSMGVNSVYELQAVANMTADELSTLNNMWLKKQQIANDEGVEQMAKLKNETLDEIKDLKDGIDGETVDIRDVGGRLVESISEGVYGAMPTLESAFAQLDDYINKAQREIDRSLSGGSGAMSSSYDDASGFDLSGFGPVEFDNSSMLDGIQGSLDGIKDMLPKMLLGTLGAGLAFIAVPKLLKWLGGKLFGKGILTMGIDNLLTTGLEEGIGNVNVDSVVGAVKTKRGGLFSKIADLFGKKTVPTDGIAQTSDSISQSAGKLRSATNPAESIAGSTTQISDSMQTTSQGMTKIQSVFSTIKQGAQTVIWIAAALAAMAAAIWVTYKLLKDVDWLGFASSLGMVAVAIGAMSAVTWAVGKLNFEASDFLKIIALAGEIAVTALAIRVSYELMRTVNFENMCYMLGEMGLALGAMALLTTFIAQLNFDTADILHCVELAGVIAVTAVAIRVAYELMRDVAFESFCEVLGEIALAIGAMALLTTVVAQLNFNTQDILNVALLAADIAIAAIAIRVSYELMQGIDFEAFAIEMAGMTIALVSMGALAFAASKIGISTKDLLVIAGIAGDIAVGALAIRVAYELMNGIDFPAFSTMMAGMEIAIGSMGALAFVASKVNVGAKELLVIAGLAADIAVAGLAIRVAYELMKGIDFPTFAIMIGEMALAIGAMGVLAGVVGLFAKQEVFGMLIILGFALDIIAVASSLRLAYELLQPVNWEDFGRVLVEVCGTIGVMAILAGLVGAFPVQEALGMAIILGFAVDIVAMASALRFAYEALAPIDYESFGNVLLEMAGTIGILGILAGAIGVFALFELAGVAVILGFAEDIRRIASAMAFANNTIPDDLSKLDTKLGKMEETIGVMGLLAGVIGIFSFVVGAGVLAVLALCDAIKEIAISLAIVNACVPNDFDTVEKKLTMVKNTIKFISDIDLGSLIGTFVASWTVDPLVKIIDCYVHIAEQLNRLQDIELHEQEIKTNLDKVRTAIEQVQAKTDAISATLQAWADAANASSVESAGTVIRVYAEVAENIEKLGDVEISNDVNTSVGNMTTFIQAVLDSVSAIKTGWGVDVGAIEQNIGLCQSILNKYSELIPVVRDQIQNEKIDEGKAKEVINSVTNIVYEIGKVNEAGGIENKEKIVGYTQSILNKFTELIPVINQIASESETMFEDAKSRIWKVQNLLYEIGKINEQGGIENKEKIVGYTQSILNKFSEIIPVFNQVANSELSENALSRIQSVRHMIYEVGQINENGKDTLADKEWIVGMATSIAWKLVEFSNAIRNLQGGEDSLGIVTNLLNAMNALLSGITTTVADKIADIEDVGRRMSESLRSGLMSNEAAIYEAGGALQSSFWWAIQNKMTDEWYQGQALANSFRDGLNAVLPEISNAGQNAQTSYWWAIQNRMMDEYYQGVAMATQFRQGLYDLDYGNAGWWAVQKFINGANSHDIYSAGYNRGYWFREGMYPLDYANAGWWAVQGFINGAYSQNVWSVGWNVANNFLNGMKARGQQGSPWKTTMEIGNFAIEGMIEGLKDGEKDLVREAETLADAVINTLDMTDLTLSPSLDVQGRLAPNVGMDDYDNIGMSGHRQVVIEQTNNNYTEYDVERVNRDLAWQLSVR